MDITGPWHVSNTQHKEMTNELGNVCASLLRNEAKIEDTIQVDVSQSLQKLNANIAMLFNQFVNKHKFAIQNDLKNPDKSKIISYLTMYSNFTKEMIIDTLSPFICVCNVQSIAMNLGKLSHQLINPFLYYVQTHQMNLSKIEDEICNDQQMGLIKWLIKSGNHTCTASQIRKRIKDQLNNRYRLIDCDPFIKAAVLSKLFNIPLVTFIMDTYNIYFKNHYFYNNYQHSFDQNSFIQHSKLFQSNQNQSSRNSKAKQLFIKRIIRNFYKRICTHPTHSPHQLIDDDINKFSDFVFKLNEYFIKLDKDDNKDDMKASNDDTRCWLLDCYPIQFDVWIIPQSVKSNPDINCSEYDNYSDDDDDDYPYDDMKDVDHENARKEIGEIKPKLISQNIDFYEADIKETDFEWSNTIILKHFKEYLKTPTYRTWYGAKKQAKTRSFKRYGRYIIIYDRRKKIWTGKKYNPRKGINKLYIYQAMDGVNDFSSPKSYLPYLYQFQSFCYSNECILPMHSKWNNKKAGKNRHLGAFDPLSGYMFCMSYHLLAKDCMRLYWCAHGSSLRFTNIDIKLVWPRFFVKTFNNTQNIICGYDQDHYQEFTDIPYKICEPYINIQIPKNNNISQIPNSINQNIVVNNVLDKPDPVPVQILNNITQDIAVDHQHDMPDPIHVQRKMGKALSDAFLGKEVDVTFKEVIEEEEYDTDGMLSDIEDADSIIIDKIVEQNPNLVQNKDKYYQEILNVLLPIVKQHRKK